MINQTDIVKKTLPKKRTANRVLNKMNAICFTLLQLILFQEIIQKPFS